REGAFQITAASEVMAILCLSNSLSELRQRLGRILVAKGKAGAPVTANDLQGAGAATALLKDALKPNLVQTVEGGPALIHGGPFGNIAHGTSSILATRLALGLGDYVVTEAGFGSDLGAEKFCNIVCPVAGFTPATFVLVATVRALKMHGGRSKADLATPDVAAVEKGLPNLQRHLAHLSCYGPPVVVAINRHEADTEEELATVLAWCRQQDVAAAVADVYRQGGEGAAELGRQVIEASRRQSAFQPLYRADAPVLEKLNTVAQAAYGAGGVVLEEGAMTRLAWVEKHGFADLPICMAKTQFSFTDDTSRLGAPTGFPIRVRDLEVSAGAGFLVVHTGSILLLPGLPKVPSATAIDVTDAGVITGLF
ncbi:MAG TPA: formate--tetrahydrofolate ligase, partial [Candidatus Xenobia bacterium]